MTTYIPLAQAIQNQKGNIIFEVVSIGKLNGGTGNNGDWTNKVATIKDNSAEFKITLWNTDINEIDNDKKFFKLENPFWTHNEKYGVQLTLGKFYKLHDATKEDLIPRQDGFAEAETKTAELKAPQSDEQQKANLTKAESILGDHLKKYDDKIKVTWALEQVAIDRLIMLDGKVPDPAKVGMYIKLLNDA